MTMIRQIAIAAVLMSMISASAAAQQWARFRGPNGAGQSDASTIPAKWSDDDYQWKIKLPGIGHASPVLWGDKLFIVSGDVSTGGQIVQCLDADSGKEIWRKRLSSSVHHLHKRNSFSSSTPAVDKDRLYIAWASPENYTLAAFDHDGEELWRTSLGSFKSQHGFGTSPAVFPEWNMVVIGNDQIGNSFVIAVDRTNGKTIWKIDRTKLRRTAYSTPCLHTPEGRPPELIFNSGASGITAVDPKTGEINWEIETFDKRSVSSPIVAGGLVFGSCGSGQGGNYVVAVRPADGKGQPPEIVYKVDRSAPYVPTPVAYGDLAFLWYDKGIVTCVDAPTGDVHWQERVGGNYSGSPVRIGDRIYCISDEGVCVVLAAGKEFKLLGKNDLGDLCRSTPAVARGKLYLRTQGTLACLGANGK